MKGKKEEEEETVFGDSAAASEFWTTQGMLTPVQRTVRVFWRSSVRSQRAFFFFFGARFTAWRCISQCKGESTDGSCSGDRVCRHPLTVPRTAWLSLVSVTRCPRCAHVEIWILFFVSLVSGSFCSLSRRRLSSTLVGFVWT